MLLSARNDLVNKVNFLGLFPRSGKDQGDCEIINYVARASTMVKLLSLPFLNGFGTTYFISIMLGYSTTRRYASPRSLTWFTRLGVRYI